MFTPQLPEKKKKKRYKGKPENIKIHLNHCKYDCIRDVATKKEFGFWWDLEKNNFEVRSTGKD